MKLRVDREVYQRRLRLMAEMIAMGAPSILIHSQAQLILDCHEPELTAKDPLAKEAQLGDGLGGQRRVDPPAL